MLPFLQYGSFKAVGLSYFYLLVTFDRNGKYYDLFLLCLGLDRRCFLLNISSFFNRNVPYLFYTNMSTDFVRLSRYF